MTNLLQHNNFPNILSEFVPKRVAVYSRVSTQHQIDRIQSDYHSLDWQQDEVIRFCEQQGHQVVAIVDDVATSKNMNRRGIEEIRGLARRGEIDVICATGYDRIGGSDEFTLFRKELEAQGVEIWTIAEGTDTHTPSGKMLATILIAVKEGSRTLTSEKVKSKFRSNDRKEKYSNGRPPFGFQKDPVTHQLSHHPEQSKLVVQMYGIYIAERSDFAVRDWLHAHKILSPSGHNLWSPGSIRDVLTNVRYKGEWESNKRNKNRRVSRESEMYRVRTATSYGPIVSPEVWEMANRIREEQREKNPRPVAQRVQKLSMLNSSDLLTPNNLGATRSMSKTKSGHMFLLQGLLFCPNCGHPLSPDYVEKKPTENNGRRNHTFVNYYTCAYMRKNPRHTSGKAHEGSTCTRVNARNVEKWAIQRLAAQLRQQQMHDAVKSALPDLLQEDTQPIEDDLQRTNRSLKENEKAQDKIVDLLLDGVLSESIKEKLNLRASKLNNERQILLAEKERLLEQLGSSSGVNYLDSVVQILEAFDEQSSLAKPEELQQLLRLFIHRIVCDSKGVHEMQTYRLFLPEEGIDEQDGRRGDAVLDAIAHGVHALWNMTSPAQTYQSEMKKWQA